MGDNINHIKKVSNHWRKVWKKTKENKANMIIIKLWFILNGLSSNRFINKIIRREIPDLENKKVLDAGCGEGFNSIYFSKNGAHITLLDITPEALDIATYYYSTLKLNAKFIQGSIFNLPFENGYFDIVWNTGVLEHFDPELRKYALKEMLRVTKKEGITITCNPNKNAPIYYKIKKIADAKRQWKAGFEMPFATLSGDVDKSKYNIKEYQYGWLVQFHFCKYFFPEPLRLIFVILHESIQSIFNFLNFLPGYYLFTIIKTKKSKKI